MLVEFIQTVVQIKDDISAILICVCILKYGTGK